LNCVAAIGSPPVIRLIMIGRAVEPPPAIAPSTHLLPVASKAAASSATAAASPPDVHQCVTSRSVAWTAPTGSATDAAKTAASERIFIGNLPRLCIVAVKCYGTARSIAIPESPALPIARSAACAAA
jgi:hypothetical protein